MQARALARARWGKAYFHDEDSFRAGFGASSRRHRAADRPERTTGSAARPPAASRYGAFGIDLTARDLSFKPGDDFWRYANNTWFAHNPIPADRTGWGVGAVLSDDVEAQLHDIVESRQRRHRSGQPPGRRHVCELDGRGGHRAARRRGAAALSRPHRRRPEPRRSHPAVRAARLSRADRRRHHAQSGRSDPLCRRRRPGRPRHAQSRILSDRRRAVRRLSRRLPQLCDHDAAARRHSRSGSQGRRDHRARAPHRRGALDAGAKPRRLALDQPDDARPSSPALAPQFNWPLLLSHAGARQRPDRDRRARRRRSRPKANCSNRCRCRPGRTG